MAVVNTDRDQHQGYASNGDGGVTVTADAVVRVLFLSKRTLHHRTVEYCGRPGREPRRRSLPPTYAMGSEVNRFSIIDSASMPTYKLPTHWYADPVGSDRNSILIRVQIYIRNAPMEEHRTFGTQHP